MREDVNALALEGDAVEHAVQLDDEPRDVGVCVEVEAGEVKFLTAGLLFQEAGVGDEVGGGKFTVRFAVEALEAERTGGRAAVGDLEARGAGFGAVEDRVAKRQQHGGRMRDFDARAGFDAACADDLRDGLLGFAVEGAVNEIGEALRGTGVGAAEDDRRKLAGAFGSQQRPTGMTEQIRQVQHLQHERVRDEDEVEILGGAPRLDAGE